MCRVLNVDSGYEKDTEKGEVLYSVKQSLSSPLLHTRALFVLGAHQAAANYERFWLPDSASARRNAHADTHN